MEVFQIRFSGRLEFRERVLVILLDKSSLHHRFLCKFLFVNSVVVRCAATGRSKCHDAREQGRFSSIWPTTRTCLSLPLLNRYKRLKRNYFVVFLRVEPVGKISRLKLVLRLFSVSSLRLSVSLEMFTDSHIYYKYISMFLNFEVSCMAGTCGFSSPFLPAYSSNLEGLACWSTSPF